MTTIHPRTCPACQGEGRRALVRYYGGEPTGDYVLCERCEHGIGAWELRRGEHCLGELLATEYVREDAEELAAEIAGLSVEDAEAAIERFVAGGRGAEVSGPEMPSVEDAYAAFDAALARRIEEARDRAVADVERLLAAELSSADEEVA